jgi:EAL domain-containing protein (putative c-di-GMP-specific phosphodiesterase class I)
VTRTRPSSLEPIARAARGEGLHTVFQPIVDLRRLTITGYEALTRFRLPGSPGPEAALAFAADRGSLAELDARCLRSAFAHRAALPPNCFLAVNVEPESLAAPAVTEVLAGEGDLRGVVIEVTERREVADVAAFARTLDRWRERGAKVAVDDAGAGHSGLERILALRPDMVKLDRGLVRGIEADEARGALVEMLGLFASRIDAWLLAEGVETRAEAQRLSALGVPLVQGRYLGAAGPAWEPLQARAYEEMRVLWPTGPGDLLALVQTAPLVTAGEEHLVPPEAFSEPPGVVVVVDDHGGPLGTLDRPPADGDGNGDGDGDGVQTRALRVNVHTHVSELAHRMGTRRPADTATPAIVTDDAGRTLGVVTVSRVLRALAADR